MLIQFIISILSISLSQADYSDISGAFEGTCVEELKDGQKNTYQIRFDIFQENQDKVKVTTTMNDYSVEEEYVISEGLVLRSEGETNVYMGGTFGTEDDSFAATVIYVNKERGVDTVLTEYRKNQDGILSVTQTAPGSRMTCGLPQVR